MPRAGYIADCFSALVDSLDKGSPMDIRVREASALHTINDVADGQFQLGIFRTELKDAGYYLNYLREKSLQYEPVWEYDALLLLSQEHPLAARDRIEPEDLAPYTQIIYGDLAVPYLPASDALRAAGSPCRPHPGVWPAGAAGSAQPSARYLYVGLARSPRRPAPLLAGYAQVLQCLHPLSGYPRLPLCLSAFRAGPPLRLAPFQRPHAPVAPDVYLRRGKKALLFEF